MTVDEYREYISGLINSDDVLYGKVYTFKIRRDASYFQEIIDELFKCYKDIVIHADNAYYAIYVGRPE